MALESPFDRPMRAERRRTVRPARGVPAAPQPAPAGAPFFIVGCHRSGTTLLQTLLDAHPRLCVPPESHVFNRFGPLVPLYGDLEQPGNLRRLVKDLLRDERIQRWGLEEMSAAQFCSELTEPTVRGVVAHLFARYAAKEGKPRWGDKTPAHAFHIPDILAAFPEAKIIHLLRDGRDVAESLLRMFFGPNRIDGAAHAWSAYVLAAREGARALPTGQFLEVRYEDLVATPQAALARILAFLGEAEGPAIGRAVPASSLTRRHLTFGKHFSGLADPISSARVGAFRTKLTGRQVAIFESIAGDLLTACGYPRVTAGRTELTFSERVAFSVTDRWLRYWRKLRQPHFLKVEVQGRVRRLKLSARKARRA